MTIPRPGLLLREHAMLMDVFPVKKRGWTHTTGYSHVYFTVIEPWWMLVGCISGHYAMVSIPLGYP